MWINVVEERKRQRKLKEFNDSKVRRAFTGEGFLYSTGIMTYLLAF